ncbi:uncharacterized protein AB675_10 [Cyphellophora attinorum]|uniref:Transcription factor domain-containing protein n=1 Tax=Cyphellophora attinorum TaxID=1664694 RepID=A0A0N0NHW8_9EURO|nr:uncharacterized protein AB675_10 [Phialophora attinorum]KPI34759.1 hypothetical protein AB675_10 [Phialophora attinorum]
MVNGILVEQRLTSTPTTPHNLRNTESAPGLQNVPTSVSYSLLTQHMMFLSNRTTNSSYLSNVADTTAFVYFQRIFAGLKSTRHSPTSAHFIFSQYAKKLPIAMHFLLAVSHAELCVEQRVSFQAPSESLTHFEAGSELLRVRLKTFSTARDHLETMLTYLYLFQFWLRRERWFAKELQDLSMSVLLYVKAFSLDEICGAADDDCTSQDAIEKALVSRVLCYLFDRDGFAAFSGYAGFFANVAMQNAELWQKIWLRFQAAFPLASRREAAVIEVYYRLIWIHHEVNCYSLQRKDDSRASTRIKNQLREIRVRESWMFGLMAHRHSDVPEPSTMRLVAVAFYHAIVIYHYRCRSSPFGASPVPEDIQEALKGLFTCTRFAVRTRSVQLLERFQWSLFIAGVETNDVANTEWVRESLADAVLKDVFGVVRDVKRNSHGCISLGTVRSLFTCNGCE